jgi:DNA-directed RNA polymerase specialized sigma24 family protein
MSIDLQRASLFQPPWRDVKPNGDLSEPYGPSPSTFTRHLHRFRLWSWRPTNDNRPSDHEAVCAFVEANQETLPSGELAAFQLVYEQLLSARKAAKAMGVSRGALRSYIRRLREKVAK